MFIEFVIQNQFFSYSLEEFAQILDIPCDGACVFGDRWSLDELVYGVPTDSPYQTNLPSPDDIISSIRIDKECQVRRIRHEEEIDVLEYQVLTREIEPTLKPLEEIIWENVFCLGGHKEYLMGLLRTKLEKVKEEKEGFEFRPTPLDLSYSGLEEFKQPKVNEYGPRDSSVKPTTGCDKESDNSKENTDDSLKQQQKTDSSSVKSPLKARGFNAVKPSDMLGLETSNPRAIHSLIDKGFVDSECSRHMSGNISHLSNFKHFDEGYVTFGGGANGGRDYRQVAKATSEESLLWHRRLGQFKNTRVWNEFCREKGRSKEKYKCSKTLSKYGVLKGRIGHFIEAARTMLADSKLPTTFWAEVFLLIAMEDKDELHAEDDVQKVSAVAFFRINRYCDYSYTAKQEVNTGSKRTNKKNSSSLEIQLGRSTAGGILQFKTAKVDFLAMQETNCSCLLQRSDFVAAQVAVTGSLDTKNRTAGLWDKNKCEIGYRNDAFFEGRMLIVPQ
ncbi:hypothetical protein Tco_0621550 [Tanacetum coccineum]